jgi:hypothetical protein
MQPAHSESPPGPDPGCVIADHKLRALYDEFLGAVRGIHDDVRLEKTRMETRIFFRDTPLCRVVAYRQLFHVQVGRDNVWEIRVRDRQSCSETLDRVLAKFLELFSSSARVPVDESPPGPDQPDRR